MTRQSDSIDNADNEQRKEQKEKTLAPVRRQKYTEEEFLVENDKHRMSDIPRRWYIY